MFILIISFTVVLNKIGCLRSGNHLNFVEMSAPMKAEPTTPNKKRVKGISLERAIVHGSIAWPLGKKAEEGKTHKWVCYVRGYNNEDVSYYIQKVVFTLHPSFINPKRGLIYLLYSFILTRLSCGKVSIWDLREWLGWIWNINKNILCWSSRETCWYIPSSKALSSINSSSRRYKSTWCSLHLCKYLQKYRKWFQVNPLL